MYKYIVNTVFFIIIYTYCSTYIYIYIYYDYTHINYILHTYTVYFLNVLCIYIYLHVVMIAHMYIYNYLSVIHFSQSFPSAMDVVYHVGAGNDETRSQSAARGTSGVYVGQGPVHSYIYIHNDIMVHIVNI